MSKDIVYSSGVIDFVTVAVEFCAFLEQNDQPARAEWIEKMIKILPLMYVKATLLPVPEPLNDEATETFVKETDYMRISALVAEIMADEDTYLDVFVEDMKYSERPVSAFVSENIADIYQDVRNFVSVYQYGLTDQMNDALLILVENFKHYWGQKLVNVLRPLHAIKYDEEMNEADENFNAEELWN